MPKSPFSVLSALPVATLLAVLFSVLTGVVHLVDVEKLSFHDYMTQVTVVWGAIAVGRGFAVTKTIEANPTIAWLNAFPWATVVTIIVGVVGYISVLVGSDIDSLSWEEYGVQMGVLIGALGIGRGIGSLNKSNQTVLEPDDEHIDLIDDEVGIEDAPPAA